MAVGSRLRDDLGADDAARAGAIVHDDGLSERLAQPLRDDARSDVVAAPGRERRDEADRPVRIVIGAESWRREQRRGAQPEVRIANKPGSHHAPPRQPTLTPALRGCSTR